MNRSEAFQIVQEYVNSQSLIRHMLAVEVAMRDYANFFSQNPDEWGLAGLLHDFDWEIHPTMDQHPQEGAPILRARGIPEKIIRCILSHADHTGVPRVTNMEHALYATDELTGLITAVALIRPSHSLYDLKPKSVRKKWNDTRFAAGINRRQIEQGTSDLKVDLGEHIERVIQSMRSIAPQLGLAGNK
jgi:putative nucleotidyltransferase with HDIG domain